MNGSVCRKCWMVVKCQRFETWGQQQILRLRMLVLPRMDIENWTHLSTSGCSLSKINCRCSGCHNFGPRRDWDAEESFQFMSLRPKACLTCRNRVSPLLLWQSYISNSYSQLWWNIRLDNACHLMAISKLPASQSNMNATMHIHVCFLFQLNIM